MSKPVWNPAWEETFNGDLAEKRNTIQLLEYYKAKFGAAKGWTDAQKKAVMIAQRDKWKSQTAVGKRKTELTFEEIGFAIYASKVDEESKIVENIKAALQIKTDERAKAAEAAANTPEAIAAAEEAAKKKADYAAALARAEAKLKEEMEAPAKAQKRQEYEASLALAIWREQQEEAKKEAERMIKEQEEKDAAIAKGLADTAKKAARDYAIKNAPAIAQARAVDRAALAVAVGAIDKRDAALEDVKSASAARQIAEVKATNLALSASRASGADSKTTAGNLRNAAAAATQGPTISLKKAQAAVPAAANRAIDTRKVSEQKTAAADQKADSKPYVTQKVAEYRVGAAGGGTSTQKFEKGGIVKKTGLVLAHSGELVIPKQLAEKIMKTTPWLEYVKQIQKAKGVSFYKALQIAKQE